MSEYAGKVYHPVNGSTEDVWEGFSWPCLFLGCFWFAYKKMWGWAALALVFAILSGGISWFAFPFFANGLHAESLTKAGYLPVKDSNEKQRGTFQINGSYSSNISVSFVADELQKLATLKQNGVITAEEFEIQKRKLLS